MAKEKKSSNSKKTNDSATKAKPEGLASLLKSKVSKLVGASGADAGSGAKAAKKASKNSNADRDSKKSTSSASTAKAAIEAPSALTKAGSESKETVPAAVAAAMNLASTVVAVDDAEVVLTDAEGRRYCRATDCDQIGMVDGYCRYHYLYYWKKIQNRKKILADGKLERYIEELTARYTDKFIELLRKDLRTEKDFLAAVQELELDDSASASAQDEDEAKTYLEEISGVASESSARDDDGY